MQPWGSANHCAMLRRGYLELLGITDPKLFNPVEFMLKRYAGPHIVALSSRDADATYNDLRSRVDYVTPPRDLGRMAAYGADGNEMRRVAFKLVGFERERIPEARIQFTQHLTPDEMWQPWLLDHANGTVALTTAHIVSADPGASAARLMQALGVRPEPLGSGSCRLLLRDSAIVLHTRDDWEAKTGRPLDKPLPAVAGIGLEVAALDATAAFLDKAGIETVRAGATLRVPAHVACGAELIFEQ